MRVVQSGGGRGGRGGESSGTVHEPKIIEDHGSWIKRFRFPNHEIRKSDTHFNDLFLHYKQCLKEEKSRMAKSSLHIAKRVYES